MYAASTSALCPLLYQIALPATHLRHVPSLPVSDTKCRQKTESLFAKALSLLQQNLPEADMCGARCPALAQTKPRREAGVQLKKGL
jgi:hypothetical protein